MRRSNFQAMGRSVFLVLTALFILSAAGYSQTRKKVEILHTDAGGYNARIVANAQRLIGNVKILVDGAYMWCDSLYSYTDKNMVDAFGNVHIVRGDTLNMYADFIKYNGDTKIAKARRHVMLIDKQTTLTTDSLDYDMNTDMAYYNYGGTVKDTANVLTSEIGQYQVNTDKAFSGKMLLVLPRIIKSIQIHLFITLKSERYILKVLLIFSMKKTPFMPNMAGMTV